MFSPEPLKIHWLPSRESHSLCEKMVPERGAPPGCRQLSMGVARKEKL